MLLHRTDGWMMRSSDTCVLHWYVLDVLYECMYTTETRMSECVERGQQKTRCRHRDDYQERFQPKRISIDMYNHPV